MKVGNTVVKSWNLLIVNSMYCEPHFLFISLSFLEASALDWRITIWNSRDTCFYNSFQNYLMVYLSFSLLSRMHQYWHATLQGLIRIRTTLQGISPTLALAILIYHHGGKNQLKFSHGIFILGRTKSATFGLFPALNNSLVWLHWTKFFTRCNKYKDDNM